MGSVLSKFEPAADADERARNKERMAEQAEKRKAGAELRRKFRDRCLDVRGPKFFEEMAAVEKWDPPLLTGSRAKVVSISWAESRAKELVGLKKGVFTLV